MIVCKKSTVKTNGGSVRVTCELKSDLMPGQIFLETDKANLADLELDEDNWAVAALFYPAMLLGEDIKVEGPVSGRLINALQGDLQAVFQAFQPGMKPIRIHANTSESENRSLVIAPAVALGFSGGVDSFASLSIYRDAGMPAQNRVTHLAHFNVGAIGDTAVNIASYQRSVSKWSGYASSINLKTFVVHSNMDEIFTAAAHAGPVDMSHTQSIRHAAAALLFGKGIGLYLHSSSYPYDTVNARGSDNIGYGDAISLPLLSTRAMTFRLAGASLTRVEKTAIVAENLDAQGLLDVCLIENSLRQHFEFPNCGSCSKCIRTLVTLEALGKIADFSRVFNVDRYFEARPKLLRKLIRRAFSGDIGDREAMEFAKQQGLKLPFVIKPLVVGEKAFKRLGRRQKT